MTTSLTMKSGFLPLYELRHDERHSQWCVRVCACARVRVYGRIPYGQVELVLRSGWRWWLQ